MARKLGHWGVPTSLSLYDTNSEGRHWSSCTAMMQSFFNRSCKNSKQVKFYYQTQTNLLLTTTYWPIPRHSRGMFCTVNRKRCFSSSFLTSDITSLHTLISNDLLKLCISGWQLNVCYLQKLRCWQRKKQQKKTYTFIFKELWSCLNFGQFCLHANQTVF